MENFNDFWLEFRFKDFMKIITTEKYRQKLPGGKASGKTPADFDKEQLAKGIKVEKEHTTDDGIAQEIAMDHLQENKNYYIELEKIHKDEK